VATATIAALLGGAPGLAAAAPVTSLSSLSNAAVSSSTVVAATTSVVVGSLSHPVAGTNIARAASAMVVYRAPLTATPTNMWGVEVTVVNGKATAVVDREKLKRTAATPIPAGAVVVSGHGTAADWLRKNVKVGTAVTVKEAGTTPVTPVTPTPVVAMPAAGQPVKVGSGTFTLTGVNTTRGVNALIAFGSPVTTTTTNQWGIEVGVVAGKVVSVNNRLTSRSTTGTAVPAGGFVLSGHGTAADYLLAHAKVGAAVSHGTSTPPETPPVVPETPTTPVTPETPTTPPVIEPPVVATSAPLGLPSKVQSLYHMMWSTSGSPQLRNIPSEINVVNLAFLQGATPTLVGWGSQSEASFLADAKAMRAKGVRFVASIGGAHGNVNLANREAFVNGVMALNAKLPLDGIDWDIEGSTPMAPADVVWISKRLKELRGDKFAITMAPNGSNIDAYRAIAVQLHANNALDMIGQQFYDAVVSKEAAKARVAQLVAAGIPQAKIGIGMMVGPQDTYWTVEECITAVQFIKSTYPGIRGGYLWEAGRPGTADWADRLESLLKS
jgi:hypothetical protein